MIMAPAQALPPLLVDDSAGARRRSMRKLLQTSTAWVPTANDRYRPTNYPAFWDWRSCKVATSNSAGCYTGAVSGGITDGSTANTSVNFITPVRDQVRELRGRGPGTRVHTRTHRLAGQTTNASILLPQGLCASCWAMASAAVIESVMAIEGALTPQKQLSTQALKNCNTDGF